MNSKPIKIWLLGGFGNVLFQILVSKVVSKKGKDFKFVKTLTEKNIITTSIKWSIHQPLYNQLLQKDQFLKISMINAVYINLIATLSKTLKLRLRKATFYSKNIQFKEPYSENIFGYFQEKHFLNTYKKEVLELGEDLRELYGEKTENIVVHYRKGDSGWAERNSGYYIKVRDLIRDEPSKVFVITDSPKDAEIFFLNLDHIQILNSKNALDDFKILLSAKKLYCAPSTFSWWAAHSLDKNAEVIVPEMLNDLIGFYTNPLNLTEIKN
jgi:hypothetical protein